MQKRPLRKAALGSGSMQRLILMPTLIFCRQAQVLSCERVLCPCPLALPYRPRHRKASGEKTNAKIQLVLINNDAPDWRRNDSSSLSPTWGALPVRSSSSLHSNRFWSGCRRARLNQMCPPARDSDISLSRPSWPASYTWPDDSARLLRSGRRAYRQLRGTSSAGSGNGFRRG